jgi:hypothetical protein
VLHQRARLPFGPGKMALLGFGVLGYLVLYQKVRPRTPSRG